MKLARVTAMAALAVGTTACNPTTTTAANANAANMKHTAQRPSLPSLIAVVASPSTSHAPSKRTASRLGPEYKKIDSFVEFRKELLADGWQPVTNPDCHALIGASVGGWCNIIPETTWASGTGYYVLHYIKDNTPLSVTLYGEIDALEKPDTSGSLWVTGWKYTTSTDDFIPEDTDSTYNPAYRADKQ